MTRFTGARPGSGDVLYSDPDFIALNARFVDAILRRWETLLEHAIHLRNGGLSPEETEEAIASIRISTMESDEELEELRGEARSYGWTYPIDDLATSYELEEVERQVLELALMPHLDLTFRRRLARFNNNILLDFVDVDLALTLLFSTRIERLQARRYFAADGRLLTHKLVALERAKEPKGDGALAQEIRIPERLADFVLCRRSIDASLRALAELRDPVHELAEVSLIAEDMRDLRAVLRHFENPVDASLTYTRGPFVGQRGLAVALVGPPGTGKSMLAEAMAHELRRPMILVDSATLAGDSRSFVTLISDLFTEARVQGAVLIFDRCEAIVNKSNPKLAPLLSQLERHGGLAIFVTNRPDEVDTSLEHYVGFQLVVGMPDNDSRTRIWTTHLPSYMDVHPDVDLEDLGTRYELTGGQIASACELAEQRVRSTEEKPVITQDLLKECAQQQIRANMDDLSVRSRISLTLDDLILPPREIAMIKEVLTACRNRIFVMTKWGFGKRLVTGKGIAVLFKGDPGTGKTLCAEILASELGMKLYQISIPRLVSKYVGETEKNISKIFASARANHSMLLFDEADSLFGKRVTNVESSIDRFSNMETNLLLQEIERFEGIVILTTNLDKNIDDAFARRIMFKIDFPKPDVKHRTLIWKKLMPKDCPVADDIDYEKLGESFELAGGNIKNAVVRAAYRAAERRDLVTWDDIEFAAEKECINAGKLFRASKLREW
ncbi:MAG: AAA family ATPase [Deltaproteobacteria bacterium]|nr:AAA family ATPase [Deltaproteobacteria bacterium]